MSDQSDWNNRLRNESSAWVKEGLINESLRDKILAKYPPGSTTPPPLPPVAQKKKPVSAKSLLPAVLIGLAVFLIGVGLILFYAANWKKMPPSLKLAQVAAMIVLSYGGAFFLLFGKRRWPAMGRGLLVLGMLSFGAGIALVVQMYHISAHPARCVLLWAGFVAAMAALMRERIGLYLSLALVLIWDIWERSIYQSPNYPMILAIAVLFLLGTRLKCTASRFICVFLAIFWFYAVNFHYLMDDQSVDRLVLFGFTQIPFGVFLISLAILVREKAETGLTMVVRIFGWLAIYAPLIFLSWPISLETAPVPGTEASRPFLVEFGIVTALAAVLTGLVARKGNSNWRFLAIGLAVGIILLFVPTGDPGIFMAIMLSALLLFHGCTLLAGEKILLQEASFMPFILATASMVIHSLGHFAMVARSEELIVAAGLSGVLFVAVILSGSLLISARKEDDGSPFHTLAVICIAIVMAILFIVSFFSGVQEGVFDNKPDWMIAALLLAILATGLGIFAFLSPGMNRKLLTGALIITGLSILLMVLPGDTIPSSLRQIVINAMLFLISGFVIAYAVEINSPALVNIGVVAIVIQVMTRYFDVFWDMLHGSIFFMVTGVVLFAVAGIMEHQRRRLLKRIQSTGREGVKS